jgi:hypothetical protein
VARVKGTTKHKAKRAFLLKPERQNARRLNQTRQSFARKLDRGVNNIRLVSKSNTGPSIVVDGDKLLFSHRVNNQNEPSTQRKVAAYRENKYIAAGRFPPPQEVDFIKTVKEKRRYPFRERGVDMAHEIAGTAFGKILVNLANATPAQLGEFGLRNIDDVAIEIADTISSNASAAGDRSNLKGAVKILGSSEATVYQKRDAAIFAYRRLNKTSRNLRPGDSSTNRGIGDHFDPDPDIAAQDGLAISPRTLRNVNIWRSLAQKLYPEGDFFRVRQSSNGNVFSSSFSVPRSGGILKTSRQAENSECSI